MGRMSQEVQTTTDVDVIPVSDPNAATMAQKIVQYQAVLQLGPNSSAVVRLAPVASSDD
jgi:hypothetical protein